MRSDCFLVACVLVEEGRYFLLRGLSAQFGRQLLLEVLPGDISLGVKCPPIEGPHDIFSSLVDLPQFAFDFGLLGIVLLGVGVQVRVVKAVFLPVGTAILEIGGRGAGVWFVEHLLLSVGVACVEWGVESSISVDSV